jgi:xylulokinase
LDSRTLWLALDIGTTGAKAALIAPDGQVVRSAYRDYASHIGEGGVFEQNADDWWQAVVDVCRELAASDEYNRVDGVALTGQMQDVILVDEEGSPLHPVILYSDTRARAEADEILQRVGAERLRNLTGNDQDAGGLLAKLVWLKRHRPDTLSSARCLLLGAADFVALKMTGAAVTDTTTASTTGLMDIHTRAPLDRSIFDELGIGDAFPLLPPMSAGGARAGALTESAANILGLTPGMPVHHGPGDAGATTIGAGSGEPGRVYAYLGTSGWIAFTSPERAAWEHGAFTLAHPKADRYIQIAPLLTAGGNLEWVRDLFGADDYEHLVEQAARRPPANVLYLPYLNGERCPFRDPLARGAFVGMDGRTTKEDLYRAVLEGVVFAYRHALDSLLSASAITLTGGGARSHWWCQLFADILNLSVAVAADAENVGVRGAALAARVASGELDTYSPPGYFPSKVTLQPDERQRQHFDDQYALFRDLYPALRPTFARLSRGVASV